MIIYFLRIAFCFFLRAFVAKFGGGETSLNPPATPKNPTLGVQTRQDLGIRTPVADEPLDLFNPDVRAPTNWNILCYSNSRYIFLKLDPQDSESVLDILPISVDIDFHLLQGMVSKWINVCLRRPLDLQDVSAFRDSINFRYGNVSFKEKCEYPWGSTTPVCPII